MMPAKLFQWLLGWLRVFSYQVSNEVVDALWCVGLPQTWIGQYIVILQSSQVARKYVSVCSKSVRS